jgi:CrcB protein
MISGWTILAVAGGGALGSVARYLINISPISGATGKFPLPTFLINITGSFLIGFLVIVFSDKIEVSENVRMAVIVGFLGAFTTFSTFEMDIFGLVRERSFTTAFLYLFLSVFVGFAGVVAGIAAGRRI